MKNKVKLLCLTLCGATVLGLSSFAATKIDKASADVELVFPQEYVIEDEYTYGSAFVVPEPSSVCIKTGAVNTTAVSVVLEYPDGTAKSEGSYILEKTGKYKLTYYNANGGSATQNFIVNKNYYEVGEDVSATYVNDLVGVDGKEGVSVSLRDEQSFTFNKSINIYDYEGETLEVCKIFPMFRENEDANPDVSTVSVKIVDCYDSTKYIEYYIWCGEAGQGVYYMGGGASTQILTGLEHNEKLPHKMTEEYNGQMYKIHRPQRYQSKAAFGSGMASRTNMELTTKHDGLTLLWDMSNHQLVTRTSNTLRLLTDVDSSEIYGTNTLDVASFFTTGEVYLNVEAYNYSVNTFNLGIERIFGMSGEDLKDGTIVDNEAPEIFVDVETTVGTTVYLEKGKAVTLPMISNVLDHNYYGKSSVAVYRNYGKRGQALLNVENGVFVPEMLGNYTAVYTAIDSYGNEGKYLLDMVVLAEQNIVYEKTVAEKLVAAKINVLPNIVATGLNKEVLVEVLATTPNGTRIQLEHNGVDGYEYVPEYAGKYTISYLFKDNVYEEVYTYEVECVDENSAHFKNPFVFPAYFMKGAAYSVAPVIAYTAGNGCFNENEAVVSVSVDGGAYQTLTEEQMQIYKVEANSTLQFKASYRDSYTESPVYSVVDVGYGKTTTKKTYENYMQGNYTLGSVSENGLAYNFDGDAKLELINQISSVNFKTTFTVQVATAESVQITLRDVYDPYRNYITYTYQEGTAGIVLNARQYANGKLAFENNILTRHRTLSETYSLSYSSSGVNANDIVFNGIKAFEKDKALFEISVSGASEGCVITLSQLNNQAFSTSMRESKPQMFYVGSDGSQEINSIYAITPCYASSVLGSVLTKDVKLTVMTPSGEIMTSVDGVRLEGVLADKVYNVQLAQVGQYRVLYEVSCLGSTRMNAEEVLVNDDYYIINVSEGIAPSISFKDGSNEQTTLRLKLGSLHKVKAFVVTDNVTASENIKVYTMIFDKNFRLAENGYNVSSYVFNNAGEFIVCVLAYDELGNSSARYYNVLVS